MEQALVVESNLLSRKQLVKELSDFRAAKQIVEAQSVSDGLVLLGQLQVDGCFLGPKLSRDCAIEFIHEGRKVSVNRRCAFLIVLDEGTSDTSDYKLAGADDVLRAPFHAESISSVIERFRGISKVRTAEAESVGNLMSISEDSVAAARGIDLECSSVLRRLAAQIQDVAGAISTRTLSIQTDGSPTPAVREALRIAFEAAFPPHSGVREIGNPQNTFVNAVISWFSERTSQQNAACLANLRRRIQS